MSIYAHFITSIMKSCASGDWLPLDNVNLHYYLVMIRTKAM